MNEDIKKYTPRPDLQTPQNEPELAAIIITDKIIDKRISKKFKRFNFFRETDISGVSGTGVVAEGVLFSNNKVVVTWTGHHTSVNVFDSLAEFEAVHGHEGASKVDWIDE